MIFAAGATADTIEKGRVFAERVADWARTAGVELAVNLALAAAIFLAGALAIKIVGILVRKTFLRKNREGLMANFAVSVATKSLWAIVLVMVLGRLGVDVAPLIAGLGVTGFILGFAFQESLGNLAAGLMIAINEPFKVGNFIEAAGLQGSVVEVNMMATVLSTPDNKRIVLPNKSVWGGPIVNYSAMATRRVDMKVGVAYGTDIAKALDVIRETVLSVPGVLDNPAPTVATAELADSQITINVRPWVKNQDYWTVYSATLQSVKDALGRAGIEIPFPQMVVHQA